MSSKWVFDDVVGDISYTCAINPNAENSTAQKSETLEVTAAPGGSLLLYEGTDQPTTLQLSGTILTQSQYMTFTYFHQLRRQFRITDDLNRIRWVYSSEWNPTRVRSATFPYKYTYTWNLYLLSETLPTGDDIPFGANQAIG
jgi:hypothetical protein